MVNLIVCEADSKSDASLKGQRTIRSILGIIEMLGGAYSKHGVYLFLRFVYRVLLSIYSYLVPVLLKNLAGCSMSIYENTRNKDLSSLWRQPIPVPNCILCRIHGYNVGHPRIRDRTKCPTYVPQPRSRIPLPHIPRTRSDALYPNPTMGPI